MKRFRGKTHASWDSYKTKKKHKHNMPTILKAKKKELFYKPWECPSCEEDGLIQTGSNCKKFICIECGKRFDLISEEWHDWIKDRKIHK